MPVADYGRETLKGGIGGGLAGLAVGFVGVYAATARFPAFRHLTLPLKAFLVTSTGTFSGMYVALVADPDLGVYWGHFPPGEKNILKMGLYLCKSTAKVPLSLKLQPSYPPTDPLVPSKPPNTQTMDTKTPPHAPKAQSQHKERLLRNSCSGAEKTDTQSSAPLG